jgi:hypothetical protein
MYDQKRLQEIAALPSPVLTVYLNTASQDPSLHPVVPACLRWFTDEGEALSRTLLSRDGRRLKENVERFERFLSLRRPQEKAIAAFVGPDVWKVLPLHICLESQLRWGKPSVTQLFKPPSEHKPYGIVVVDHHGARFFRFHLGELIAIAERQYEIDESRWRWPPLRIQIQATISCTLTAHVRVPCMGDSAGWPAVKSKAGPARAPWKIS